MKPEDVYFMKLALREGRKGLGRTSPNPPVGAVVVKEGRVVGKGYHRRAGTPHAEVHALREAGEDARGATLYVTLEPCNHHGRTPPCTEAILKAGITRVVIGCSDPNPKARGGAEYLASKGLQVEKGVLLRECATLCRFFLKVAMRGLPWVLAKSAMSLDGRIATRTGDSKWITGEEARRYGHRLRAVCDAILVGKGTVLADDPALTCRLKGGRDPVRFILDTNLSLPLTARVFRERGRTVVWCGEDAPSAKEKSLSEIGVEVWRLPLKEGKVDIRAGLLRSAQEGILSVLVEGGARVHGAFFDAALVDEVAFFYGPLVIGGEKAPAAVGGRGPERLSEALYLANFRLRRLGDSFLVEGFFTDPATLQ